MAVKPAGSSNNQLMKWATKIAALVGVIPAGSVTNAMLANMASPRVKARGTAGTGSPEDIAIGNGVTLDATSLRTAQQMSVTVDGSGLKLSGDATSPGNSLYYGTDSGGTKGFFALPSGVTRVGSVAAASGTTASITGIPACKMLFAAYRNISHDNGANQTFRFALSTNNGSSYNTAQNMFTTALGAGVSGNGILTMADMDQTTGGHIWQSSFAGQILGGIETVTTGALVNAIQFSFTAGNYDDANGRIDLYVL